MTRTLVAIALLASIFSIPAGAGTLPGVLPATPSPRAPNLPAFLPSIADESTLVGAPQREMLPPPKEEQTSPGAVATPQTGLPGVSPGGEMTAPKGTTIVIPQPGIVHEQFPLTWFNRPESACLDGSVDQGHNPTSIALRLGWWGVKTNGSPWVIGQWQDLHSSEFVDLDGLYTNGEHTLNYSASELDRESSKVKLQYYGPATKVNIDYQRLIHQQEHLPLDNFFYPMQAGLANPPIDPPARILRPQFYPQDLNVGENYAIRVEQFKATFQKNLTENIKARVDVWDMRQFGTRQSNTSSQCYLAPGNTNPTSTIGRRCHILSEKQGIDWNTFEVTPRLQANFGSLVVEYSRDMRVLSQNDQQLTRIYDGSNPELLQGRFPYANVPENFYQMDKLKLNWRLGDNTSLYSLGYIGSAENDYRKVRRDYSGFDTRLTNTSIEGVSVTAYAKNYNQSGDRPTLFLPDEQQGLSREETEQAVRSLIGFNRYTAGLKGRWMPGLGGDGSVLSRVSLTGGYEWEQMIRVNETWANPAFTEPDNSFKQPNTRTQTFHVGVQTPWSADLHTYARYKALVVDGPLFGFRQTSGVLNTSQPDLRHIVEVGGDWYPSATFGASVHQDFDLSKAHSEESTIPGNIVDFKEQSYSTTLSLWYVPTHQLTLSANAAYLCNWINQNITLGDNYVEPDSPYAAPTPPVPSTFTHEFLPVTRPWNYGGTAMIVGGRADYLYNKKLRFTAGYEYVQGKNGFDSSGFADLWPDLPSYSKVRNRTQQISAGMDWMPRDLVNVFFRYNFSDYTDKNAGYFTGQTHMFLAGLCVTR